jgi:hypothetical protein
MKRLIIKLIVFAILLLSAVSNAEITGDLTNANAVMTGDNRIGRYTHKHLLG